MGQRLLIIKFSAILLLILYLSGCWIPEDFKANIIVFNDGSYKFTYDGILTSALVLAASMEKEITKEDEIELAKGVNNFRNIQHFKKAKYLGNGRYKVLVEKHGKPGEPFKFVSEDSEIFSIEPQTNGGIYIKSTNLDQKSVNELKSINAQVNGRFTVSLEKGVKAIQHNSLTKTNNKGVSNYIWNVNNIASNPSIIVKPATRGRKVQFCNESSLNYRYLFAFAYYDKFKNSWVSKGWYTLDPGECITPLYGDINNEIYLYGIYRLFKSRKSSSAKKSFGDFFADLAVISSLGVIEGNYKFCVHPEKAFEVVGHTRCRNRGKVSKGFQKLELFSGHNVLIEFYDQGEYRIVPDR